MSDNNISSSKELTVGGTPDPTALAVQDLAEKTGQWIDYALAQAEAGQTEEVARALQVARDGLAELQLRAGLTAQVMGGLQEAYNTAIQQRDEAIEQVADLEETFDFAREEAFNDGQQDAYEMIDAAELHQEYEDDFANRVALAAMNLRRMGRPADADALEARFLQVRESRDQVDGLLDGAESDSFQWR